MDYFGTWEFNSLKLRNYIDIELKRRLRQIKVCFFDDKVLMLVSGEVFFIAKSLRRS